MLDQPLCEMLPSAGVYYFPWEINSSVPEGKTLRTFGRLCCYDLARSEAILTMQHNSAQYQVCVDTKFVEPFQAQVGSSYMVLGEAEYREGKCSGSWCLLRLFMVHQLFKAPLVQLLHHMSM
ncbi:CST complex subunit TEN1 isoform X2 [Haemorhous mexicanus]|uniref:CST complex subunit TEN1 isoform X2 n=1 Tax=Haemorhous mexicanus TaxID=30427 RepID=UPI0028BD6856|nr:CST complex subunit TEN1 isoform X2 [Haemorhous mexicanus]